MIKNKILSLYMGCIYNLRFYFDTKRASIQELQFFKTQTYKG